MHKIVHQIRNHQDLFCIVFLQIFCAALFLVAVFYSGLPYNTDLPTNLAFAFSYHDGIIDSHWFPDWANDNLGFGSIGVRFYPPIAFISLALAQLITNDWLSAIWINLFFWMCLGCTGVYLFIREWSSPGSAIVAGMLYAVVPYRLAQLYPNFMYADFAAASVMPFCFLFVTRICRGGSWKDVFFLAIAYSTVVLTHIPTTIIMTLCLPVYVLGLLNWRSGRVCRIFLQLSVSFMLILAATVFRSIRLVTELPWLAHNEPKWHSGAFFFKNHMFPLKLENCELLNGAYGNLNTGFWCDTVRRAYWLLNMETLFSILLLIPALLYLFTSNKTKDEPIKRVVMATTTAALFALFMQSKLSVVIWSNLEFLQKIQFPWRWLSMLSMLGVMSFALSVSFLTIRFQRFRRWVVYSGLALVLAMMLFDGTKLLNVAKPMTREWFNEILDQIEDAPIAEWWWPIWAKREAFENRESVSAGIRSVDIVAWEAETREFTIGKGAPLDLRVATFYYPLWKATINDKSVIVNKDQFGAITIPLRGGVSKVHLYFEEPFLVRVALWLSSFTWIFLMVATGICLYRSVLALMGSAKLTSPDPDKPLSRIRPQPKTIHSIEIL